MCIRDRYQRRVRETTTSNMSANNQATAQPPQQSSPGEEGGLFSLEKNILIYGILIASFVEMWAAIAICDQLNNGWGANYGTSSKDCDGKFAWAVACGLISLVLAVALVVLGKFKPNLVAGWIGWIVYGVLFFLWAVGVVVFTMDTPFAPSGNGNWTNSYGSAGNGYISTWMAALFSAVLFFEHVEPVTNLMAKVFGKLEGSKRMFLAILLASFVEFWHAARICDDVTSCAGMLGWGVSAGVVSCISILVFVILSHFMPAVNDFAKYFAAFLALWWTAAVCTLTMPNGEESCSSDNIFCQGLFLSASNGFFGTWIAMLLSLVLTAQLFNISIPGSEQSADGAGGAGVEEDPSKRPTGTATPAIEDAGAAQTAQPTAAPSAAVEEDSAGPTDAENQV
eukprot:TRINITY_DN213_c0_g2_i1.p1 TRINITY_DN213_c0_g2~~TRINITY_DN213_c0_g2_i1.p1  ORF type:complete len:396 (+),score=97.34 TRINITY_DN213_c0_g2_i1:151-1338(+)